MATNDFSMEPPPLKRARKNNSKFANPEELERWLRMFSRWSPQTQVDAVESIISNQHWDIDSLRRIHDSIDQRLRVDFISYLPRELSLHILSFLKPQDLLRASQVCRYWRVICEDNLMWREICKEEKLLEDKEVFNSLFIKRKNSGDPNLAFRKSNFKLAYLKQASIMHNWRCRKFEVMPSANTSNSNSSAAPLSSSITNHRLPASSAPAIVGQAAPAPKERSSGQTTDIQKRNIMQLRCHDECVITCLQFNPISNIIVSGSDDMTLRVWDAETGRCLRKLEGHTGGVWSSQLSPDDIVISGSTDRTIRVWNAISGQLLFTLYGHSSTVRCMSLHEKKVVSGSRDHSLRLWNIEQGVCERIFTGHTDAVRCVEYNGELIVSGAYDCLVKVWDAETGICLHSLMSHEHRIYSLQFDGRIIASGSLDTSICIWDAKTGALKHKLRGHTSLTSKMQLKNNILVSANADSHCKVWNIETGECLLTLNGHTSAITSVHFNNKFVVTSSDDGTVKLWDVKTGQFIRDLIVLPTAAKGGVVWRIRASNNRLVCAVGARSGAEDTQLLVLDFGDDQKSDNAPRIGE